MIRVLVVEDHHLVRQGICALLERAEDIQIAGEARDGQEAVELAGRLKPDVVLMDLSMPRLNGTLALERIRSMRLPTKVIILSMYSNPSLVRQALRSGARGYLLKHAVTEELLLAVRAACRDEVYLSPSISEALLAAAPEGASAGGDSDPSDGLTTREKEVLKLIAEGKTNGDIARILSLSVKTVEKHRANLMGKLNIHDLTGLVRAAMRLGLIPME